MSYNNKTILDNKLKKLFFKYLTINPKCNDHVHPFLFNEKKNKKGKPCKKFNPISMEKEQIDYSQYITIVIKLKIRFVLNK